MKVVDVQDGRPIAGAHVCFSVPRRRALTGHGGRTENLFAVETTTNDAGELRLPSRSFPPWNVSS
jgi:hypothetical protein